MKSAFVALLLMTVLATTTSTIHPTVAADKKAAQFVYEGEWITTNRKLDGIMTAEVTDLGDDKWKGRFYGIWMGVKFDCEVKFSGPPDKLTGTAKIDGADYEWKGEMSKESPGIFKETFDGSRYIGSFNLKSKK